MALKPILAKGTNFFTQAIAEIRCNTPDDCMFMREEEHQKLPGERSVACLTLEHE